MSSSMLEDLAVTPRTYICPECEAEGKTTTFTRPQSLGAHRRNVHGVAGTSKSSQNGKTKTRRRKPAAAKPRSRRKAKQQAAVAAPAAVSLAPVPPDGLNESEYAAFRLGSIQTLLAAVEEGRLDPPGRIFLDGLAAEVEYLEWMLAAE